MKKWYYLIISGLILFLPVGVVAMPAYPGLVKIQQPDGDEITIYMRGDEKVHWMESPDGYSLMYDKNKYIVFAEADKTGNMVPSSIIFRDARLRSSTVDEQLANIPKNLRYSASQVNTLKQIWNMTKRSQEQAAPKTVSGTIRAICPLVQFQDVSFKKTKEDFEQLMNQAGYDTGGAKGSVRDFYYENSYGGMELIVTVLEPYTVSHNLSYYGENGANGSNMNMSHMMELARQVANNTFSQSGINPSDYDNDNDGYIDAFHLIYAGYGEEAGGNADAIWSHACPSGYGFGPYTYGNKKLDRYSCSPELRGRSGSNITRIGVICHEMGHIFGLPDFYDTDYEESGGSYEGTGKWDLMAGGSWNGATNDGSSPAHINMYAKIQLGWVNPVVLDSPQDVTDMPNSAMNAVGYIYNTPAPGEYFVLENRQKAGFDSYVPGSGLLIYHVSPFMSWSIVNATHPQRMYPVCASSSYKVPQAAPSSYGNINSAGCPFPGTSKKTSFTDESTPSSVTWSGMNTSRPITEIKEQDKLISFRFMQTGVEPVSDFVLTEEGSNVLLNWKKPNENVLGYIIYRNNDFLIKLAGANTTSYTQNNVGSGVHNYCVSAYYEQGESVHRCGEITMKGNPNLYPLVKNLNAVTLGNSVELTWSSPFVENRWVTHADDFYGAIYYQGIEEFSAVVRFTADDLKSYIGGELSQVKFYINNASCNHTIQIWRITQQNPATNNITFPDITPTFTQAVQNTTNGDITIDLNTPVKIEAGGELWIGINYKMNSMTPVAGVDSGPDVENRNFIMVDNGWYPHYSNYNFYIAGGLEMPKPDNYNVYRNGEWIKNVVAEYYLDNPVSEGGHIYCVSAIYDGTESEQACVQSPFLTGISKLNPSDNVKTYPNPLKQGDMLTIDLENDFAGAKVSFYSVSGQLLQQTDVSERIYRKKINFAPGVYTLQIIKNSQITNRKIIVQ
jgi:M6 family metalloprotease-like protein